MSFHGGRVAVRFTCAWITCPSTLVDSNLGGDLGGGLDELTERPVSAGAFPKPEGIRSAHLGALRRRGEVGPEEDT